MSLSSKSLPENIRKCMVSEDRKELRAPTQPEADAKFTLRREKELQENIARLLDQRDIWYSRQRMDKRSTTTLGTPDFLFAINGQACAVECKMPGEKLTDDQFNCMAKMNNDWNGWRVDIVRSEAEFLEFLKELEVVNG